MDSPARHKTIFMGLPASYSCINILDACVVAMLAQLKDLEDRALVSYQVELAVHETCANIVEHAYADRPGRIGAELSLDLDSPAFTIELHDTGSSFELPQIQQPNQDEIQATGYGLFLIHQLMDQVIYRPETGNNRWQLVKFL